MTPAKTYPMSLPEIEDLCDAISELDGLVSARSKKSLIERCHRHIQRALGDDVAKVYAMDDAIEGAVQ